LSDSPNKPKRPERIFSLVEANTLIPHLSICLEEIARLRAALMNIVESKSELAGGNGNPLADIEQTQKDIISFANLADRIKQLLEIINQTGVVIKDLDAGVIDFLFLRGGRKVYLCWRVGENRIRYWHELLEGEGDRKPI